jgi:hypothetical protein
MQAASISGSASMWRRAAIAASAVAICALGLAGLLGLRAIGDSDGPGARGERADPLRLDHAVSVPYNDAFGGTERAVVVDDVTFVLLGGSPRAEGLVEFLEPHPGMRVVQFTLTVQREAAPGELLDTDHSDPGSVTIEEGAIRLFTDAGEATPVLVRIDQIALPVTLMNGVPQIVEAVFEIPGDEVEVQLAVSTGTRGGEVGGWIFTAADE